MPENPHAELLDTALSAAHDAGDVALSHFRKNGLHVETKHDGSPVTIADRETEKSLRRVITDRFPEHTILGEEYAAQNNERLATDDDAKPQWIIDPIDGTASFIRGVPLFGTLIGVVVRGAPVVGVMHFPALGETVYAASGAGAWYRSGDAPPIPARASFTARLADATICTTSDDYFRQTKSRGVWSTVRDACASTRGWSDSYAFLLLATGRIDAVVEPPMLHPWDAAAAIPVIQEAGGVWTSWDGACSLGRRSVAASNAPIHAELLDRIRAAHTPTA